LHTPSGKARRSGADNYGVRPAEGRLGFARLAAYERANERQIKRACAFAQERAPGRDLPLRPELDEELKRVERAHRDAGRPIAPTDFWISARDGGIWSEHQARNWREREFRPIVRQVAADFPQFPELGPATPYLSRQTFVSSCLQAGISLATIAAWSGTSIQMISRTYGRMIRRHEGTPPLGLSEQYETAKVQAGRTPT
jgi:hypothetical protein